MGLSSVCAESQAENKKKEDIIVQKNFIYLFKLTIFFTSVFDCFKPKNFNKRELKANRHITDFPALNIEEIYQKKKQVNCFRFLTKRSDVPHGANNGKKVMEPFNMTG